MKSLIRFSALLAIGVLVSLPAPGQDRGPVSTSFRPAAAGALADRNPIADFIHCLRILDLTEAQKTAIQQFIEAEKPTLQSLHDEIRADRQTLRADASATPPDPCKVGADFLKVVSDREAIHSEVVKIRTFIESQLTDQQKARFEGCLLGSGPRTAASAAGSAE